MTCVLYERERMNEYILVVEDEADLGELLKFNLQQAGYEVAHMRDGASALESIQRRKPDLILLDLMLPDMPGTSICKQVRSESKTRRTPIIMMTARGEEIDRVVGFELGADDYVVKPFSPRELVLRVGAVLRRTVPDEGTQSQLLVIGVMLIDVDKHRVTVEGEEVPLTAIEFKLLLDLMSKPGRVQTRDALLERVWGYASGVETRTVDTHVKRLREKLGAARDYIETIRGVGYRVRDDIR